MSHALIYVHSDLLQNTFKFPLRFLPWPIWGVGLNLHAYWDFSHKEYGFCSFRCVNMCSMLQNVVLGTFQVSLRRTCILLLLDGVVCKCQCYPVDRWCFWVQLRPSWFSACCIYVLPMRVRESPAHPSLVAGLSIFVSHSWTLKNCVFLENRALYHHAVPFLVLDKFSRIEVCLVWN